MPIGCSPFGPRQHSGWALIFFRRHKPHADWPSPGRARYAWPPWIMAMGVDFDQEKRQKRDIGREAGWNWSRHRPPREEGSLDPLAFQGRAIAQAGGVDYSDPPRQSLIQDVCIGLHGGPHSSTCCRATRQSVRPRGRKIGGNLGLGSARRWIPFPNLHAAPRAHDISSVVPIMCNKQNHRDPASRAVSKQSSPPRPSPSHSPSPVPPPLQPCLLSCPVPCPWPWPWPRPRLGLAGK